MTSSPSALWRLSFIAAVCAFLTGCLSPGLYQTASARLPGWCPAIIDYEWDDSYWNQEQGQQSLNAKSAEWCALLDAKLFVLYSKLMEQLDDTGKKKLAAEQGKWLRQREQLTMEAGKEHEGGTLESLDCNVRFGSLTQSRIQDLEKQLARYK
jgi:uncharacterized protein YecT (DUF1311 family)